VIVPEVAPTGTEVVILVKLHVVTVAGVPLNATVLLAGVASKFVPVIVTAVPIPPDTGVNDEMTGGGITVKLVALVAVWAFTVTVSVPEVAPAGTEVVMLVEVLAVTIAVVPLN
jgi:hypothetical protein